MSSLEEKLSRLNNQYQVQVRKCNTKYDELVREYRKNQPEADTSLGIAIFTGIFHAIGVGLVTYPCACTLACFDCLTCLDCLDGWYDFDEGATILTVLIMVIVFLFFMNSSLNDGNRYRSAQNSINALERERNKELEKLQKDYDVDRNQITVQYNRNREIYLQQLRKSDNTLKLKGQIFSDFERIYGMIDKSVHIKELSFSFFFALTQDDIMITALQGRNRFHDVSYRYERMQMKRLENIELCEALAVVLSQEVDFMIKEHHKQAKTNVECIDTKVRIEFDEVNMNYKGLKAW